MIRARRAEAAAAAVLLAAGAIVASAARTLPYWQGYAPGPGFFPLWLGILLAAAAAIELARALVPRAPAATGIDDASADLEIRLTGRTAILAVLSVAAALLVIPLGFVLAIGVFVALASWVLAPQARLANAAATLGIPFGIWLIFAAWLGVPLPRGPLGF
jgi:putative tricarboxylic transport membrane protein